MNEPWHEINRHEVFEPPRLAPVKHAAHKSDDIARSAATLVAVNSARLTKIDWLLGKSRRDLMKVRPDLIDRTEENATEKAARLAAMKAANKGAQ